MAYVLRYSVNVDWLGPGEGPASGLYSPVGGLVGASGGAQTIRFTSAAPAANVIAGTGTAGAIAAADITTLVAALSTALTAQMNAATALGTMQGFATGGA